MKKTLLIAAIACAALTTQAQKFYVQGGLNLANITKDKDGNTSDNTVNPTFNAGAMATFGISKVFDMEAGLLFTGKGAKYENSASVLGINTASKIKFTPYYIELPVNLMAKLPLEGKDKSLFLSAGPYIAMGVAGKVKTETTVGGSTSKSSDDIEFNNDDPTQSGQQDASFSKLKRFDYGANFGAGIDFGPMIFKVGYGLGLAKINSTQTNNSDDQKNKYRTLSFSIGIPLGR